jgi:hypothetical protein
MDDLIIGAVCIFTFYLIARFFCNEKPSYADMLILYFVIMIYLK